LDNHRGEIVFRAALITAPLHLFAQVRRVRGAHQHFAQFVIGNVSRDAVGAQQESAAVFDFDHLHVGFDRVFRAERAADYVLAGMIRSLFGSHTAGSDFFFDDRMILGLAPQFAVRRQPVKSRIANVTNRGAITIEVQRDDGGGHHRKARILSCHLMDRAVGPLNGQLHQIFNVFAVGNLLAKRIVENIDRSLRSDLARVGAAHAIGDDKDAARRVSEIRIFIERPLVAETAIGNRSNLNLICR
jgi:hypothetical protein